MNSEKRMNNCETEKNYICHSERAVATEESISFVIPAKAEIHPFSCPHVISRTSYSVRAADCCSPGPLGPLGHCEA